LATFLENVIAIHFDLLDNRQNDTHKKTNAIVKYDAKHDGGSTFAMFSSQIKQFISV